MVYRNIIKLCDKKKITIQQLEKDLGFGNGTVGKWKRFNPTSTKLKAIAEYFEVSMEELMKEEE